MRWRCDQDALANNSQVSPPRTAERARALSPVCPCGLPGASVHGILQARALEWGALPDPGVEPVSPASPALAGGFFIPTPPGTE